MSHRSASTNLMCFWTSLYHNLSSGKQVDTVYTDFKAAFDSILLSLLVAKLRKLVFGGSLLPWFNSYLENRSYVVKICGSFSECSLSSSGVPQGSVLSSLLFILFLNDCTSILPLNGFLIYTDDVKIFLPVSSTADCLVL